MVSNATISQEVLDAFAGVKNKSLRYAIAGVQDGTSNVVLLDQGAREETMDQMKAKLGNVPCYISFDFEKHMDDGRNVCKNCFIKYSPDTCTSMPQKMALQNYGGNVKSAANPNKEFQINDLLDLTE